MPLIASRDSTSGKETQAAASEPSSRRRHRVEALTFPDDATPIGKEIRAGWPSGSAGSGRYAALTWANPTMRSR